MRTEVSKSTTSKTSWPIGYFMKCLEVKGRENGLFHRLAPSVSYLLLNMKSYSSFQCPFWPHLVGFRTIYILFVKGLYSYSSRLLSLSMSSYPAFLFLNIENCILFSLEKSHLHNYKSVHIFFGSSNDVMWQKVHNSVHILWPINFNIGKWFQNSNSNE